VSGSAGLGGWAGRLAGAAAVSALLHAGGLALAARLGPRPSQVLRPVEVDFETVEPPPPPPEPPRAEPPPPPEPRAPPRRVAVARLPPPPKAEKPPPPPPPNEPPPPDAPPARAAPRVGVSLSSTASGGGFAVGVGNTLYGKAPEVAADPREVKPYSAQGTAPPPPPGPKLSSQPRLLEQPEVPPYPEAARRAGLQGQVKLLLHVDRQGRVVSVRVLSDPGGGLGEAARAAALRFRFSPGVLDGEPVEVPDFPHTYTFVLE
jgi:periplasmic protein TonB